jgi:hypothetical protein
MQAISLSEASLVITNGAELEWKKKNAMCPFVVTTSLNA